MATTAQLEQDLPFPLETDIGMSFMTVWTPYVNNVPGWWSIHRDNWLQNFWRNHDPTKIAVATFTDKALAIPVHILPKNTLVDSHVEQAEFFQSALIRQSGVFRGFRCEFEKFVQDYLTNDNGAFMLIMGNGRKDGPIIGPASGLFHLDSGRCTRTGDPEYPVVYTHTNGVRYKLHNSRIIALSHLPSPRAEMYGVGLCAVSCELDAARELKDMVIYAQEKMGSRPSRDIIYVETGSDMKNFQDAIKYGQQKLDSEGLVAFSKSLLMAPKTASGTLKLGKIDLSSTPDGFNRHEVTLINMAIVATAFGLDLRDLAFNLVSAQTRADAEVQDRKGKGKGVGTFLEKFQEQLDLKFLPEHLYSNFDNQDDDQDMMQANIWNTRSQARDRDLTSGIVSVRVARQRMLRLGEITQEEFEDQELSDGRLPNGLDIYSLFYVRDTLVQSLLDIGLKDPFTDRPSLERVRERKADAYRILGGTNVPSIISRVRQSLAALLKLEAQEMARQEEEEAARLAEEQQQEIEQEEEDIQEEKKPSLNGKAP